jgi:excinuclease ABC subunit B
VSYYDYYQPEAYMPNTDTYIEKDSSINDEIERLRHAATAALLGRTDVLIVASVSCIYGLGSPEAYHGMMLLLEKGMTLDRDKALRKLVEIQYRRINTDLERGSFRVRGDVLEIWPSYAGYAVSFLTNRVARHSLGGARPPREGSWSSGTAIPSRYPTAGSANPCRPTSRPGGAPPSPRRAIPWP